jgi:hypothetical protein
MLVEVSKWIKKDSREAVYVNPAYVVRIEDVPGLEGVARIVFHDGSDMRVIEPSNGIRGLAMALNK